MAVLGDGRKIVNGANWHTDDSFMREPCSLTMLYGVVVPSRGVPADRRALRSAPGAGTSDAGAAGAPGMGVRRGLAVRRNVRRRVPRLSTVRA